MGKARIQRGDRVRGDAETMALCGVGGWGCFFDAEGDIMAVETDCKGKAGYAGADGQDGKVGGRARNGNRFMGRC